MLLVKIFKSPTQTGFNNGKALFSHITESSEVGRTSKLIDSVTYQEPKFFHLSALLHTFKVLF